MLTIKNVHKFYEEQHVLKGIDLEIKNGEVVVLFGDKNSGKSVLLRCLNYLDEKDEGEIWFEGQKLCKAHEDISMVFQHFNLFPHKTILENVIEAPMIVHKVTKEKAVAKGMKILKKVQLGEKAYLYPKSLSSGEKKLVAIARALAMKPKVMLFDGPTAALDSESAGEVLQVMKRLAQDGMTMIIVTDEINFSREIADRMVLLENGRVVEQSAPDKFFTNPKTEIAKQFLKDKL